MDNELILKRFVARNIRATLPPEWNLKFGANVYVKRSGAQSVQSQFVAKLPRTSMKVLKAPRLPRKSSGAQSANFPLPSLLPNQSDTLHTARSAAAEGYLSAFTIPLLAEPETLVQTARLNWILRFPLPPPNPRSNRRFSSTPSYHYGPRTPQALDAAIRYAANFSYDDPPPTHPHTAAFVQLPGPATRFGDIRRPTTEPPSPPPSDVQRWLQSGAIRLHSQSEYQLFGANITHLPPLLESHFFGHISLDQLISLLSSHPSDPQALQTAIQQFRASKRAKVEVPTQKYVNIPSEKYIYVHIYVCICVNTYLCKMDERRSYASLS